LLDPTYDSPHNRIIQAIRYFARYAALVDSAGERMFNQDSFGKGKFLGAHLRGYIAVNGSRRDLNFGIGVSFVDPFPKLYEKLSPGEVLNAK